jgi:hypothetical protein
MFRSFALGLSTIAVVASLGLAATSASAKPIKFPQPHPHFHSGFGPLALFGAAAALGVAASEQPQSNCWVQPQAVEGPYGPYVQNVTVCN